MTAVSVEPDRMYFLTPAGPQRITVSSNPATAGQHHRRLDQLDHLGQHGRALAQHAVHEPRRWRPPAGQVRDQLHAAFHRHMLVNDEVDDQRLQARPVAGRCRGHTGWQRAGVLPAAAAADPPHVMLGDLDGDFRQVVHLMRALDAHVFGGGQVRPAGAAASRAVARRLIRGIRPAQPAALSTRLLAPAPPGRAAPGPPPFWHRLGSRSSLDGGMDEFPESREMILSSRATRRASPAGPSSRSATISRSRAAHDARPAAGGGRPGTSHHDEHILAVIKSTRWASLKTPAHKILACQSPANGQRS